MDYSYPKQLICAICTSMSSTIEVTRVMPAKELQRRVAALRDPPKKSLQRGYILAAIVVLMSAGLGSWWLREPEVFYIQRAQTIYLRPTALSQEVAQLERGEPVTILGTAGYFARVRDTLGRTGYVLAATLDESAPASFPELPFVACRSGFEMNDGRECAARAAAQRDSCANVCDVDADTPSCFEQCRERFDTCMHECSMAPRPPTVGP